jgi:site-specific recombinase XerD
LIGSVSGDQPHHIRDKAILMLLAIYGFRRGEVARLRLDEVNCEHEVISVARPKQRRAQPYPLVHGVGEALLRYLREVRPRCAHREIFLTLKAAFRPLSPSGLYRVVNSRLSQFDIQIPRRGPHSLRHACAGHLVAEGFSLKEIGDHLGHRSACATRIYAQVDLAGLREVAKAIGDVGIAEVQPDGVQFFLAGTGPITRFWHGAGLRISEALSLTLGDVNLTGGLRTIRESKCYQTRLVPLGPDRPPGQARRTVVGFPHRKSGDPPNS